MKKIASVRDEQMDTENNLNVQPLNTKKMESIITPTFFVDAKTKTHADVVWEADGKGWIYKNQSDNNWPWTADCKPVKYPASVLVNDYLIRVIPYERTYRKRYTLLNLRQYSKLRRTLKKLQLMIYIPLLLPPWLAERVMRDEFEKQIQFLKKHVWNKKSGKEVA